MMLPDLRGNAVIQRVESAARRRAAPVIDALRRRFLVALVVRTLQEMSDDDGTHMAAGVAYYAIFSLFPLLLGLIAVFNFLPESETTQAQLTDFVGDYLPGSQELLDRNVEVGGALGVVAIFGLIWSGSAIFGAVTRVVNRAWDVHKDRPLFVSKPRQMAMALTVGIMFLVSLSAATFVNAAGKYADSDLPALGFLVDTGGKVLLQATAFLLTLMTFLLVYKLMPNTKTYWRYIWPGAVVATVLFELAKTMFILYLERFAGFESVYGSLGDVIVLLLWVYVSSLILILGAELSSEYGRLREGVGRGVLLHPRGATPPDETAQK